MPAQLLPFLLVVVVVTLIPGPDTALGLRNSLRAGTTGMWWTGLGCCAGLLVHAVISVLGLSALLAASATAYLAVKVAGAAYLVWLGASTLWKSWRDRHRAVEPVAETTGGEPLTRLAAFRQGLVSNVLNPKIIVLFLTRLPQFISPGEPRAWTSLALTLAFVAVAVVYWRLASWLVGGLRQLLTRKRVQLALERVMGAVMVGFGLRMVFASD